MSCVACKRICPTAGKEGSAPCIFFRPMAARSNPQNLQGRRRCMACLKWLGPDVDKPTMTCSQCQRHFCPGCYTDHLVGGCK
jgi:hypothetical protein